MNRLLNIVHREQGLPASAVVPLLPYALVLNEGVRTNRFAELSSIQTKALLSYYVAAAEACARDEPAADVVQFKRKTR